MLNVKGLVESPVLIKISSLAGVKKAFIPKDNIEDLKDIPEEIKEKIEVIPVTTVKEVLKELKLIN